MNEAVTKLEPTAVWTHFENLNAVPRPSKREERVIAFMKQFGESLNLETIVDEIGNVIIRKPATAGMENRQGVILQGHLDMVHQKNSDTPFDFETQGIESYIDDDGWLKARGTTLGADNGMGVASIMAVLSSTDLEHGPVEALFTIDEETGMTGAFKLQPGILNGSILLNTDTEDEGELCIGCAGGVDTNVTMDYSMVDFEGPGQAFKVSVKGLRGGHSGCEIHLGRGNANKIMNRLLWNTDQVFGLRVQSIDGGSLRNAIPRESFATVVVAADQTDAFKQQIASLVGIVQTELVRTEPNLMVSVEPVELTGQVMDLSAQTRLAQAIYAAPCGVIRMSNEMPNLVETSTSLARVLVESGKAVVQFLTRSSVETARDDLANMIEATFCLAGASVSHSGGYPGWKPNADSEILRLMKQIYEDLFGHCPKVNAVHAGLECGIIGSVYQGLDMISFGPTIKNPHSPDEKCEIASVSKYWQFMVASLKNVPTN
ncbi:MAG: dipeptidase D [Mariniblastus sp.]|jgi:dipeptidase D